MNKKAFALIFCSFLLIPAVCRAEATEVIAIVGAMREETEPILVRMSVTTSYTHENAMIWKGSLNGKDVILAQCGIGQKNAESF
jgi:hypothetical protein